MSGNAAAAVYVHGLWMPGHESALLRRRLAAQCGFRLCVFHYDSVHEDMAQIAARLQALLVRIEAPQVHLLGHSLGGLVILRCLERYPMAQPGRVVFMGTPSAGSRAARRLGSWAWGRRVLGRAVAEELLLERSRRWDFGRELGIIAGSLSLGLARLLVTFGEANDGVVAVSETRLEGAADWTAVPVNHAGLVLSARVARETGSFLEHGRFRR
ncbi:MAG: alpha/beta hydrolase [Steroidobacteraceae bacterium]